MGGGPGGPYFAMTGSVEVSTPELSAALKPGCSQWRMGLRKAKDVKGASRSRQMMRYVPFAPGKESSGADWASMNF
jgi:hypothetical protein